MIMAGDFGRYFEKLTRLRNIPNPTVVFFSDHLGVAGGKIVYIQKSQVVFIFVDFKTGPAAFGDLAENAFFHQFKFTILISSGPGPWVPPMAGSVRDRDPSNLAV